MSEIYDEFDDSLYFWQRGLFIHCPYTKSQKGAQTKYVFYTDMKANGSAGEHQLSAEIEKLTNAPIDDREICDAFIESVSKKILTDVSFEKKDYVDCLKTLPKGFYTERNVELILENVLAGSLKRSGSLKSETAKQAYNACVDTACCDLMEYAHSQNSNVRKGTGREHIGE